ncbi:MAG TPA: hypothetical protein DCR24_09200 [Bacillus bacterium]|nr:hypothetical protein [Bacillus sp. (in: firmicutes)]
MGPPNMRQRPMQSPFVTRPMRTQGHFSPMMGRGPQRNQGGGLLAKLLGKGSRGNSHGASGLLSASQGTSRGATQGGGILQTLTNPTALNGFLNNTQNVLKTAQQFGPMIQQYGPLVRNLPSMWKLYRGLKDLPDADDSSEGKATEANPKPKPKESAKPSHSNSSSEPATNKTAASKKSLPKGTSTPKLFI